MSYIDYYIIAVGFLYPLLSILMAILWFIGFQRKKLIGFLMLGISSSCFFICGSIYILTRMSFYQVFVFPERTTQLLFYSAIPFELVGLILSFFGAFVLCAHKSPAGAGISLTKATFDEPLP